MDLNWKPKSSRKNEKVEYKIFLKQSGLKIKKFTQKTSKSNNKNTVSLKIYHKTHTKQQVKIISETNTSVTLYKKRMKKINCTEEHDLTTEMDKPAIATKKRNIGEDKMDYGNIIKKKENHLK